MTVPQLAPEEPLSPELVLVLPPERRAQVLATLEPPAWPAPKLRVVPRAEPAAEPEEPLGRVLGRFVAARVVQLGVIFAVATIVTIVLSLVAHAVH